MEINEVLESINLCITSRAKGCSKCRYKDAGSCAEAMMKDAVKAMQTQQQRITELEAELKDERHRHDRYVDFELAEAEELRQVKEDLRLAMEQLEWHCCDYCKHEALGADEYPCNECINAGGHNSKWEWKKPEPPKEVE